MKQLISHGTSVIVALAIAAACSCANDHHEFDPDSETHFLRGCSVDKDCGGGTSCVCGVCTKACSQPSECASVAPSALCTRSVDEGCSSPRVCDVLCSDDIDCKPLGSGHVCSAGRCRVPAVGHSDAGGMVDVDASSVDARAPMSDAGSLDAALGDAMSTMDAAIDATADAATDAGAKDAGMGDADLPYPRSETEPCQASGDCQSGLVCSQLTCKKDPCMAASCAMIPAAPMGDATCMPAATTRDTCGSNRSCAAGLICHIDNTCIQPGACDANGLATLLDSTNVYLDAIDEHYLYGQATRNGAPALVRWSSDDGMETMIAMGSNAAPQYPSHAIVDADKLYWIGPKQTLETATVLMRTAKDGTGTPENLGEASPVLAQDEGYLYVAGADQRTLYRIRKDAPETREPIYMAASDKTLNELAASSTAVFVGEVDANNNFTMQMLDKLTLGATMLPLDSMCDVFPFDEYLYLGSYDQFFPWRYNLTNGKLVELSQDTDWGSSVVPLDGRVIVVGIHKAPLAFEISSIDPITGDSTLLLMLSESSGASSFALASTSSVFAEDLDGRMLKFMLPAL